MKIRLCVKDGSQRKSVFFKTFSGSLFLFVFLLGSVSYSQIKVRESFANKLLSISKNECSDESRKLQNALGLMSAFILHGELSMVKQKIRKVVKEKVKTQRCRKALFELTE